MQKRREPGAEFGRSGHHQLKQLLLQVSREVGHSSMAACSSIIAALVWSMVITFRRKWTNLSFVPAYAELRFPVLRTYTDGVAVRKS